MGAQIALDPIGICGGLYGQSEHLPGFNVDLFGPAPAFIRSSAHAGGANPDTGCDIFKGLTAHLAVCLPGFRNRPFSDEHQEFPNLEL
jgi:hypothetical protein